MNKLFVVLVFLLLVLAACSGEEEVTPEALETVPTEFAGQKNPYGAEAAVQGVEVFEVYCASCHGEMGRGDGPAGASLVPAPKDLVALQSKVEDDYLFWRISEGKSGTAMVAWKGILTDEQIWQTVAFIRSLK